MIIAVSGWREWLDKSILVNVIGGIVDPPCDGPFGYAPSLPMFRFGDCPTGIDRWIMELVMEWHLPHERYIADWEEHGKFAGPLRNRSMLKGVGFTNERANLLLAFPEPRKYPKIPGSGTWGCIGEAAALGIPTMIYPNVKLSQLTGYNLQILGT